MFEGIGCRDFVRILRISAASEAEEMYVVEGNNGLVLGQNDISVVGIRVKLSIHSRKSSEHKNQAVCSRRKAPWIYTLSTLAISRLTKCYS